MSDFRRRAQVQFTRAVRGLAAPRQQTMLGDTAVAVNPNDERYGRYVGQYVTVPIAERKVPVIGDTYVDNVKTKDLVHLGQSLQGMAAGHLWQRQAIPPRSPPIPCPMTGTCHTSTTNTSSRTPIFGHLMTTPPCFLFGG